MSARVRWWILIVALGGLAVAVESSWVHYRVLTDPTYVSPCDLNRTFSCSEVYLSRFGTVAGVPVALGGVSWFALVALVAAFAKPGDRSSASGSYLFLLSIAGLAVVLYLAYVSSFVLHTYCVLCLATYACVLAIFALAMSIPEVPLRRLPRQLLADIRRGASRPVVIAASLLYLGGTGSFVALFPREVQAPGTTSAPDKSAEEAFREQWSKQPRVDLGIHPDGARVVIVKFSDYECPACRQAEEFYQPILKKFEAADPGSVRYLLKDWPWNRTCNFNVTQTIAGHEASCAAAAAARMARDKGKYDEMASWLWANQGTSPEGVAQAAGRILGITDFDQQYALKLPDIRRDIADGGVLQISATPTFFINGVRLDQMIRPEYFELAVKIELEKK